MYTNLLNIPSIINPLTEPISYFTDIRPGFVATEILGPEFDYPIVMPVEKAADHILKGIRKKRRVFTFDWKFRLISVIWRLIPRALWERMTFVRI